MLTPKYVYELKTQTNYPIIKLTVSVSNKWPLPEVGKQEMQEIQKTKKMTCMVIIFTVVVIFLYVDYSPN